MQLTLGRVHWGWCIFPLHNQSLTQTLADHRFLVTIILGGDSWTLIIISWLKNPSQHTTPHQEAQYEPPSSPDDVAPPATPAITCKKRKEKKREFDYDLLPCVFSGRNKYYIYGSLRFLVPSSYVWFGRRNKYMCIFLVK